MKLKGAIFDMDGTLLDSMGFWDQVGTLYVRSKGLVPRPGLRQELWPLTIVESARYFRREYGVAGTDEEIVAEINHVIADEYKTSIPLKAGAKKFLDRLKLAGVRMCVATATDRPLVESAFQRLDLGGYFLEILTCSEVGVGKEQPDIFEQALNRLGTSKTDTVVFEDALHAIQTAKAAGFLVAAIEDDSSLYAREQIQNTADWYLTTYDNWRELP